LFSYKPQPIKDFSDSKIVGNNTEYLRLLNEWIPEHYKMSQLIFRGRVDGFKAANFHHKCDNKGTTVALV